MMLPILFHERGKSAIASGRHCRVSGCRILSPSKKHFRRPPEWTVASVENSSYGTTNLLGYFAPSTLASLVVEQLIALNHFLLQVHRLPICAPRNCHMDTFFSFFLAQCARLFWSLVILLVSGMHVA